MDTWSGLEDLISLEGEIHRIFLKNRYFFLMRMDGIENDENMQLSLYLKVLTQQNKSPEFQWKLLREVL